MLALALGKHLHEIDSLPHAELMRWMRFYAIEPFGLVRDDLRSAIIATAAAQPHSKKRLRVADFMPKFKRPRHKQDQKTVIANALRIAEFIKCRQSQASM